MSRAVDGTLAVGVGGQAVAAGLVKACVSEEFGDDDEVVSFPYEVGSEGVAKDVGVKFSIFASWAIVPSI